MKKLCIFFLVTSLLTLNVCAEKPDTEADIEAINNLNNQWIKAFNTDDLESLMTLLADDVIYMPPNSPDLIGKKAIRSWYNFGLGTYNVTVPIDEVRVFGDWAFARRTLTGTWTPKDGGEPVNLNNASMTILRRQPDGSWKISHAIFNSNTAPSAQ